MKEMVGGCCVCSDDSGWPENPLVYCDGPICTVAVHQACYGIVTVPAGNWFCRKCESLEGDVKVRCELCPNKEGALKPTDNDGWAHVVCALYIPEVRFGNVTTMEPIILAQIPPERYNKTCDICEKNFRGSGRSKVGACMQCNKPGCRVQFHVTCAQSHGLLCEEAGNNTDNVKYCGYCQHHYTKLKKGANVKVILPYRPIRNSYTPEGSPIKETEPVKTTSKRKLSTSSSSKVSGIVASGGGVGGDDLGTNDEDSQSSNKTTGGQDSDLKLMPGKRKKGSRTPPVSGVSPEASPRPITPLNSSTSSANSSTGPASLLNVSSVVVAPPSLLAVPPPQPPLPASSPSRIVGQPSSTPQRLSTTPPPLLTSSNQPAEKKSSVVKESRPNSIVVNVPLEVALPSAASANSSEGRTPPRIDSAPVLSSLLPTVQLEDINHVPAATGSQSQGHHSSAPSKRARSQSGDKSEKSRRSSKRNSSGGTSSKNMSSPPRSHSSREKSDGSGHHNHHSGGGSSGSHHHHGGYSSDNLKSSGRRHHSSSSSTLHSTSTSNNSSSSLSTNHLSHQQPGGSASSTLSQHLVHIPSSSPSPAVNNIASYSHSSNSALIAPNKDDKAELKILTSSNVNVPHMLGNTLNPSSTMAQKMCDTLSQEIVAHSVYNSAANGSGSSPLVGPQLPHRGNATAATGTASTGTNNNNNVWMTNSSTPQSLEQLLERQWEQGSQFLMEQAQHFDIASLLSCLHQLRAENAQLEDHVNSLMQRRDHLLAVNARLAIPLVPPANSAPSNGSQTGPQTQSTQPIVENGLPPSVSPHEATYRGSSAIRQLSSQSVGPGTTLPSVNNPVFNSNPGQQNSVLVRASSSDSRRSSQSPAAAGAYSQIYQQTAHLNQSQVVMRRDVIEAVSSASSNPSQSSQQRSRSNS